jgi:hypothetical protein
MKRFMVIVGLAACGGGGGPASESEVREGCQKICTRDVACAIEGEGQELDACVADCTDDLGGWPRADAFGDLTECIADLPCDGREETCLGQISRLPIHDEWEDACRANLLQCEEQGVNEAVCTLEGDEEAALLRLISEPIMEDMIDCMDAADCGARLDCIDAVFETNGIDL